MSLPIHFGKPRAVVIWMSSFLSGIVCGTAFRISYSNLALVACALGVLATFKRPRSVAYMLLFIVAGTLYVMLWRQFRSPAVRFDTEQQITGTVSEAPDTRQDSIFLTVRPDLPGFKSAALLVKTERYPEFRYGDRIQFTGTIVRPKSFSGFDYPLYLERFGVYGQVSRPKKLRLISHDHGNPIIGTLYALRQSVVSRLDKTLVEPESSFLAGILLGSKRSIPQDVQDALKQTGTSHIVAISGANITITLGILLNLLPLYRPRPQLAAVAIVATSISLITGVSASVVRGSIIACVSWYLRSVSRRSWPAELILLSMTSMVLANPLLIVADPGFQLSFAAFAGLSFFGPGCTERIEDWKFTRSLPDAVKGALAETTAATIGTAALSLRLFGQISFMGLLVNPLVLWLLPAITLLGFALVFFGWLPVIAKVLALPLWLLLHAALSIIGLFGSLKMGVLHASTNWPVTILLWCASSLGIHALLTRRHAHHL